MSDTLYVGKQGHAYYFYKGTPNKKLGLELDGFDALTPKTDKEEGKCASSIVLVQNVMLERKSISVPVIGVDKHRVLYTFGENFGSVVIDATILPGGDKYDGKQPKDLLDKWENKGLANSKTPVNLSWAGVEVKVFIQDVKVQSSDPATGAMSITLTALIAPVTNKG